MAVTVRDILSRVLINLGEDAIDPLASEIVEAYHKQLLGYINTIKKEIEDSAPWRTLQTTNTVSVLSPNTSTVIPWANARSRLVRIEESELETEVPLVFDITDADNPFRLIEMGLPRIKHDITINAGDTYESPSYFTLSHTGSDVLSVITYPPCSATITLQLTLIVPQDRFTTADVDTEILIPDDVLELGVTWYAMEERGEELGTRTLFSQDRYLNALNDAISRDIGEQGEIDLILA